MAVTVDYKFALVTQETVTGITGASISVIDYSQFEVNGRLNSTSTPPATKAAYLTIEGTGVDSGSIDFTALAGPLASTIDATGLKLQMLRVTNKATSTGNFALATGSYGILGYEVAPRETVMQLFNDSLDDVSGGAKTLDWSCTDDCEVQITLIFG